MKIFSQKLLWGAASAVLLTGCIDNNYDLSDIDTTSEFRVDNLTLPLNLNPVVLSDIIKVNDDDQLKEYTINDHKFYAVEEKGTFKASPKTIDEVTSTPPTLTPSYPSFDRSNQGMRVKRKADGTGTLTQSYTLHEKINRQLEYSDNNVDGAVKNLTKLYFGDLSFIMKIEMLNVNGLTSNLSDIRMSIPKGLTVEHVYVPGVTSTNYTYDASTGDITIYSAPLVNNATTIEIVSTALDLTAYDNTPFKYNPQTNKGEFNLNADFNINAGTLEFTATPEALATLPDVIEFYVDYTLTTLTANAFLGSIEYQLDGVEIDPVELNNLPDFLEDPETDIMLANPQIWLNLENPVSKFGLSYAANLDIVPLRDGMTGEGIESPTIEVPTNQAQDIIFLLSPQNVEKSWIPEDYDKGMVNYLAYTNLGDILSTGGRPIGIPKKLDINVDARIPYQTIPSATPFELGQPIEGMEGSYLFLAPLTLKNGSTIEKTVDGWWTEDLADLNIEKLTISADITNGLPTGVNLKVYAIDKDQNRISTEGMLMLDENAVNAREEVTLTGIDGKYINNLDGIRLSIIAVNQSGTPGVTLEPLAPEQSITLDNIKAKVTGNYTRKL